MPPFSDAATSAETTAIRDDVESVTMPVARDQRTRLLAAGLLTSLRPSHWAKNLLVFAAPAAAGSLGTSKIMLATLGAFVGFCLAASGVYLVNDILDARFDRAHPSKRRRPVASGRVSVRTALAAASILFLGALAVAFTVNLPLGALIGAYIAMMLAYSLGLKHWPFLDIGMVATGFFLRPLAGAVAAGLRTSVWFLAVAALTSLYVIAGKRYGELHEFGDDASRSRRSLGRYSHGYLEGVIVGSAGVSVVVYGVWAFQGRPASAASVWTALTVIPFVLGVLRYGLLIRRGRGQDPVEMLRLDRPLQLLAALWLALFIAGVYSY